MNFDLMPFLIHKQYVKFVFFILSFLLPAVLAVSACLSYRLKNLFLKFLSVMVLTASLVLFSSRFIEPGMILVHHTELEIGTEVRIALISDLHLGLFKDEKFVKKLVKKIKSENPDIVLIAGDLMYWPKNGEINRLLSPFRDSGLKIYSVLGNHDVCRPGPDIRNELEAAMEANGIILLNNSVVSFQGFTLAGLGDMFGKEDDVSLLNGIPTTSKIIVLTHNPDTSVKYRNRIPDITLSGHLHGGQIRIPFLYKKAMPSAYNFDTGLNRYKRAKVFVTAGTGEVGLPLRFLNPPAVDILHFH